MAKIAQARAALVENEQLHVQLDEANARIAELEQAVLQKPAGRRAAKS